MALAEPIIVVLGPWCGGTSAVACALHHLGVYMGTDFDWTYREPHETWEDLRLSHLCRRAFSEPGAELLMDPGSLQSNLRSWADEHRRAARLAGRRPGVKHPVLCAAIDFIRDAWGPVAPVVVDRPLSKVVGSLNRLGWWKDEQERVESTQRLIAACHAALGDTPTIRVDFEALRATPIAVIRNLAHQLHLEVTAAQVEAAAKTIRQPDDLRPTAGNGDPYQDSRDLLLAEVERNPEDMRSVFFLAQTYLQLGDFDNARRWYERRAQMGGWDEEVHYCMFRVAQSMSHLEVSWQVVQDAYLRAWEFRPTRAEPLYAIARQYRVDQRYRLGYQFAKLAAEIPLPEDDILLPLGTDIYAWRAIDERAVCASWIDKQAEAFTLCRGILARPDIPDEERPRISGNRDVCVPTMLEAASSYPETLVHSLLTGTGEPDIVVSLIAGPDRHSTEQTLNSFLHCCTDASRIGRFLALDTGLSPEDRATLQQRYGFLEFADPGPADQPELTQIRAQITGRFWLHLGQGWRFFAPENFITRLTAVLHAEPQVSQVAINYTDATHLTATSAPETAIRRAPDAGRYVLTDAVTTGPAMTDTTRLDQPGGTNSTATLDEILCITAT